MSATTAALATLCLANLKLIGVAWQGRSSLVHGADSLVPRPSRAPARKIVAFLGPNTFVSRNLITNQIAGLPIKPHVCVLQARRKQIYVGRTKFSWHGTRVRFARPSRGVWGHAPPEKIWISASLRAFLVGSCRWKVFAR